MFTRSQSSPALPHTGDHSPSNKGTVLVPRGPILDATPFLVAVAAVDENACHEDGIRPGKEISRAAKRTHGVREHQVTYVIDMASNAPPSCELG